MEFNKNWESRILREQAQRLLVCQCGAPAVWASDELYHDGCPIRAPEFFCSRCEHKIPRARGSTEDCRGSSGKYPASDIVADRLASLLPQIERWIANYNARFASVLETYNRVDWANAREELREMILEDVTKDIPAKPTFSL